MQSLNMKDLEYFSAVFMDRSFSQAAKICGVSQPTLTLAIKRLEEYFQTSLLIRDHSHQRLVPTSAGTQLAIHAKSILHELSLTKQELRQIDQKVIRLGLPPIIGNYYFPRIFPELFKENLTNLIDTVEAGSSQLQMLLQHGKLEIALLGSIVETINSNLHVDLFAKTHFKIVVSNKSRLAQKDKINFSDLKNEAFIILNNGFVHEQAFNLLSEQAQFKPNVIYRANDIQILKAMIQKNLGIGFLSETAMDDSDQLHEISLLDKDQPLFYMSVAYRKNHNLTSVEKELLDILHEQLAEKQEK